MRLYFFILSASIFISCSTQNMFLTNAEPNRMNAEFLLADYEYRIQRDDKLSISIWDHDELSVGSVYGIYNSNEVYGKWLLVNNIGNIELPKIGTFQVLGLSINEFQDSLKHRYSKWIKNPIVYAKVLNNEITVLGEFKSPGKIKIDKEKNTLMDAIGSAGDFDFYADKRHIQVIRQQGDATYDVVLDLTKIDAYTMANITVLPGDVIYAPSRKGKQFDKKSPSVIPIASAVSTLVILINLLL